MEIKYGPYSPSRLDVGKCGFWFNKQYIEKDPIAKKENLAAARGAVVHLVFEKMNEALKNNPEFIFRQDEINNWIAEAVKSHPIAYVEIEDIMDMCIKYARRPIKEINPETEVEVKFAVKIEPLEAGGWKFVETDYDDQGAFFRGRADVLIFSTDNTSAIIYDHKTQPNIIKDGGTFQMGCYAWALWKTHPYLDKITTVLHFARYGCYSEEYVWTKQDLEDIEAQIITRVMVLEQMEEHSATPSDHCQYCPYVMQCPVLNGVLSYHESDGTYEVARDNLHCLGDANKAFRLAETIMVLEEWVKEGKKNLQNHIKTYETPIVVNGTTWGYKPSESVDWDKANGKLRASVMDAFKKREVDPTLFMSFNQTTTAKKLATLRMSEHPLVDDLDHILTVKTTSSFGSHKNF